MKKPTYIAPQIDNVTLRTGTLLDAGPGIHFSKEYDQNEAEGNRILFFEDMDDDYDQDEKWPTGRDLWNEQLG